MSPELSSVDRASKNWLPRKRPLPDRKTNFRSFICSHVSTKPGNLAKIGPADVETIGPKGIGKKLKKNKKQQHAASQPGGLNKVRDRAFSAFQVFLYEDRTRKYDAKAHEKHPVNCTPYLTKDKISQ